jgi:hypothetical protein
MILNTTPGHKPKGIWVRRQWTHLHTHVPCSTIHKSQAVEAAKMPTTDEYIRRTWYVYTMEYYSATKKNEIMLRVHKWMELVTSC